MNSLLPLVDTVKNSKIAKCSFPDYTLFLTKDLTLQLISTSNYSFVSSICWTANLPMPCCHSHYISLKVSYHFFFKHLAQLFVKCCKRRIKRLSKDLPTILYLRGYEQTFQHFMTFSWEHFTYNLNAHSIALNKTCVLCILGTALKPYALFETCSHNNAQNSQFAQRPYIIYYYYCDYSTVI